MPRWLRFSLLSICSFLCLALAMPTAHAEDKAKAVKLLAKGDKALAKGNRYMEQNNPDKGIEAWEEALALYTEAYEAYNNPKIFFPIARAEQLLGHNMEAMDHYQQVLKGAEDPKPELVAQVDKAIEEVRKELIALDLTVEQDGAVVSLDGKDIGLTPLDGPLYMPPGGHKYTVTLDGYSPQEEMFDLTRGQTTSRTLSLEPLKVTSNKGAKKPKKATKTKKKGTSSTASTKPLTISFGVAGALLIGAGFTGIAASARHDRYQDVTLSDEVRTKAQDSGKTYRLATDVLLASGVLAAAYGTYYYYSKYKGKDGNEKAASNVRITPYASGEGAGVALGASF